MGTVWGYSRDMRSDSEYIGAFATREEAITEGRADHGGDFYIRSGAAPVARALIPCAADIMGAGREHAMENGCPDHVEEPIAASPEALSELDAFLVEWTAKHVTVNYWIAEGDPEHIEAAS